MIDRNDYKHIRNAICGGRDCDECKIDHNIPCSTTPDSELVRYARELYRKRDRNFMLALEVRRYRESVFRYIRGVKYE